MDTNGSNSNSRENQPSDASNIASRGKLNEKEVFVNNGMYLSRELASARKIRS